MQAVINYKLIVFSADALDDLSTTVIAWNSIINQITAKSLIEKVNRISPMLAEDAKARYISFLDKFP